MENIYIVTYNSSHYDPYTIILVGIKALLNELQTQIEEDNNDKEEAEKMIMELPKEIGSLSMELAEGSGNYVDIRVMNDEELQNIKECFSNSDKYYAIWCNQNHHYMSSGYNRTNKTDVRIDLISFLTLSGEEVKEEFWKYELDVIAQMYDFTIEESFTPFPNKII